MIWRTLMAAGLVAGLIAACEPANELLRDAGAADPMGRSVELSVASAVDGDAVDARRVWVFFEQSSHALPSSGESVLREHAAYLAAQQGEFPRRWIVIAGHADDLRSRTANVALAQRRADAVRDYLERIGLDGELLSAAAAEPDVRLATVSSPMARPGLAVALQ